MKPSGGCVVASAANYLQEARHYLLGQMGAKTRAPRRKGHSAAEESAAIHFLEVLQQDLRDVFSSLTLFFFYYYFNNTTVEIGQMTN